MRHCVTSELIKTYMFMTMNYFTWSLLVVFVVDREPLGCLQEQSIPTKGSCTQAAIGPTPQRCERVRHQIGRPMHPINPAAETPSLSIISGE